MLIYQGSRGHLLDLLDRAAWRDELNAILESVGAALVTDCCHIPVGSRQPEEWGLVKFVKKHCAERMEVERFANWWVRQGNAADLGPDL